MQARRWTASAPHMQVRRSTALELTSTGSPLQEDRGVMMETKVEKRRQQAQLFTPAHRHSGQRTCRLVLMT